MARPFRYATARDPLLATRGGKVAVIAKELGRPLLPHQQYIADVTGELNPPSEHGPIFRYQTVIISEPRQVGKTTLIRPIVVDRTLTSPNILTKFTAQKGKDARERWEDMIKDIRSSPTFAQFASIRAGKGDETLIWPNGSQIRPFAPTEDGVHGGSPDMVGIDECWAFDMEQGQFLQAAIRPSMITRRGKQVWYYSAAGTAKSAWWEELCELGRQSTKDPESTIAYFEHSADPDADPYDPATWDYHPGLDGLITIDDIQAEVDAKMPHEEFIRAYLNIPAKVNPEDQVIDPEEWGKRAWDDESAPTPPPADQTALGFSVAIDQSTASIYAAWQGTEHTHIKVFRTGIGTHWLAEHLTDAYNAGYTICADDGGDDRIFIDQLRRDGVDVKVLGAKDSATAWGAFKTAVRHSTLSHDGSPALAEAISLAVEKPVGSAIALDRNRSRGLIDPLIAAVAARWHAERVSTAPPIY